VTQGVYGGRDLTREARDGRLRYFEYSSRDRASVDQMLPKLRELGVGMLIGSAGCGKSTTIYNLAGAIANGTAPDPFIGRRLIEAPYSIHPLAQFAEHAADLAGQRDIVLLELDEIYSGVGPDHESETALPSALTRLFVQADLWIIAIGTPWAMNDRLRSKDLPLKARLDAHDGVIGFSVLLHQGVGPTERLIFKLPRADALTLIDQVTRPPQRPAVSLAVLLEELVSYMRTGKHKDEDNHTILGGAALAVFASGLSLRPGHMHVLSIEVLGQRYRVDRSYAYTDTDFLGP